MNHSNIDPQHSHVQQDAQPTELQTRKSDAHIAIKSREDTDSARSNGDKNQASARPLKRSWLILVLILTYTALAIFSWRVLCILVQRPINASSYGLVLPRSDISVLNYPSAEIYSSSERWFRVVTIIQTILAVATIPVTLLVCSCAAVMYVQTQSKSRTLSTRQTAMLGNKDWSDLDIHGHLLYGGLKQCGSKFLYLAVCMTTLGAIILPIQSIFLTATTVHSPQALNRTLQLTSLFDPWDVQNGDETAAARLRATLTTASKTDAQSRLWSSDGAAHCKDEKIEDINLCTSGQSTLAAISTLEEPFLAQLPAGYSTGLIRQFLPRLNSSVSRERIDASQFPTDCSYDTSAFFANYSTRAETQVNGGYLINPSWSLIACMPRGQGQRTKSTTTARQDFSETLYLNLSAFGTSPSNSSLHYKQISGTFKLTMNTTQGHFELPNYINDQKPGPLLPDTTSSHCGSDCVAQGPANFRKEQHDPTSRVSDRDSIQNTPRNIPAEAYVPNQTRNKGPLLTIALALFGPDSFIADRVTHPENFVRTDNDTRQAYLCTNPVPFFGLLNNHTDTGISLTDGGCTSNQYSDIQSVELDLSSYVAAFIGSTDTDQMVDDAFRAAGFLANEQWLLSSSQKSLYVSYDLGQIVRIPHISTAGIILISTLLGIYLAALLSLALYACFFQCWIKSRDWWR